MQAWLELVLLKNSKNGRPSDSILHAVVISHVSLRGELVIDGFDATFFDLGRSERGAEITCRRLIVCLHIP